MAEKITLLVNGLKIEPTSPGVHKHGLLSVYSRGPENFYLYPNTGSLSSIPPGQEIQDFFLEELPLKLRIDGSTIEILGN